MNKEEKDKLDSFFAEWTAEERRYLKEEGNVKTNEYGAYIYTSSRGNHSINLEFYLRSYRAWLIDEGIVKQL